MNGPIAIPLLEPDIGAEERRMADQCLQENWISSAGPYVDRFEATLADRCSRSHAVATASGTTALHLLLIATGIGTGDRVILPDWTFAATANAVIHAGAEPVFVDVDRFWELDAGLVQDALANPALRAKAIIAVDPPNSVADFHRLQDLADRHGIMLIEDAAGALGSRRDGEPAGGFGDAAIVSFNGNKIMTTGAGGAILTDNAKLADQARHLAKQARSGTGYHYDAVGFNCRMAAVNAAIGMAQLARFDETLQRRQAILGRYTRALAAMPGLTLQPIPAAVIANGWMTCIRLENQARATDLIRHLDRQAIAARPFWTALSNQKPYSGYETYRAGMAEDLSGTVVSLPSSSTLTEDDQSRVLDAIQDWAAANGG